MRTTIRSIIFSFMLLIQFASIGYCIMDGPIYTEKNISYADFAVGPNDLGANGNMCEIRIQPLPQDLSGYITGQMVVNSYANFTGNIISTGGTTFHVTLANGGGFRAPVRLAAGGGGSAIYFISDDPAADGDLLCQNLSIMVNRVMLTPE